MGFPSTCTHCGNAHYLPGLEECDDGNGIETDGCNSTCQIQPYSFCDVTLTQCDVCGNSLINTPETCDDSNRTPLDGCSSSCQIESGWNCTGIPSDCSFCGNSVIETPNEECDDGNTVDTDGCSLSC